MEESEFWFVDVLDAGLDGIKKTTGYKSIFGKSEYTCGDGWLGTLDKDIFRTKIEAVHYAYRSVHGLIYKYKELLTNLERFYETEI